MNPNAPDPVLQRTTAHVGPSIRAVAEADREWAAAIVAEHFRTPEIVSRGVQHDTRLLPGLLVEQDGARLGLLHYRVVGARCEVVTLIVLRQRQGIGRRLLCEVASLALACSCSHLWLVTTNDNRSAQKFYDALGWRRVALHRGAVTVARRLKPEIPNYSKDGTPIEDEIEYEFTLAV